MERAMIKRRKERTKPEVFIIESLEWTDEQRGRYEGRILTDILRLSGKKPIYYYVRTKQELVELMHLFQASKYRYLHLSCHGDMDSIETTLDIIDFKELGTILNPYMHGRRLFVSSCEVVNPDLAKAIITPSDCLSIAGPTETIPFSDAAILWASFYKIAFDWKAKGMTTEDITLILDNLATLFYVPVAYYGKTRTGYFRQVFDPRKS